MEKNLNIRDAAVLVVAVILVQGMAVSSATPKKVAQKELVKKATPAVPDQIRKETKSPAKASQPKSAEAPSQVTSQAKKQIAADVEVPVHARPLPKEPLEVLSTQLTADGGFVDVRYMVRDNQAAKDASEGECYIIVESTGRKLTVPSMGRIGALKQNISANGRVLFTLFGNSPPRLEPGEKVTFVLGKLKKEHIELR